MQAVVDDKAHITAPRVILCILLDVFKRFLDSSVSKLCLLRWCITCQKGYHIRCA